MPTYSYQCEKCEHGFDSRHSMNAPSPQCPSCGGAVRKVLTAPAVVGGSSAVAVSPSFQAPSTGSACGCGKTHGCH